jgi:hypothetical protein
MGISSDPKKKLFCPNDCVYATETMTRRIITSSIPNVVGKVWAGDWFKKTYGHDIGEASQGAVNERSQYEKEKMALEEKGIRMTHKSRQVDGKDRISLRKKDD